MLEAEAQREGAQGGALILELVRAVEARIDDAERRLAGWSGIAGKGGALVEVSEPDDTRFWCPGRRLGGDIHDRPSASRRAGWEE